jgi:hypothetical protein
MRSIANEESASLLSCLRFGEPATLTRDEAAAGLDTLIRLEFDFQYLKQPSNHNDVLIIIEMVAATVQVETPLDVGQTAYAALLQHLPRHVLRETALEILRTHKFRTLPLPAEFLDSETVTNWKNIVDWFPKMIEDCRRKLQKLLSCSA